PHLAVSTDHHVRSQCDTVADLAVVRDMRAAQEIPVAADAGRPFGPLMDAAVFADAVAVADAHAEPVPLGITRRGVLPRRRVGRTTVRGRSADDALRADPVVRADDRRDDD